MAEPTISLSFADIWKDVAERRYNDRDPDQEQEDWAKRMTNLGYLKFLRERPWRFLAPNTTLTAWDDVAVVAGTTVTSSGTTLTASAASFYREMIGATITIASTDYTIEAYTSTTVVTISAAPSASAVTFAITGAGSCRLPDGFVTIKTPFRFATSESHSTPIEERSAAWVRARWAGDDSSTGVPRYYAIEPIAFTAATGQRHQVIFEPIPDSDYSMTYAHDLMPSEMTTDTEYPLGGALHSLTIRQAALAMAEQDTGETNGAMAHLYQGTDGKGGELARSIEIDNRQRPRNIGYNGNRERVTAPILREVVEHQ